MAERRMFAKAITESDAFLEMPLSTQALYFHFGMNADDDGFVRNPRTIRNSVGAGEDDLKLLLAKRFIIGFESGIIVVKHWFINNRIQSDRYKPTTYIEEKAMLRLDGKKAYTERDISFSELPSSQAENEEKTDINSGRKCVQNGYKTDTQYSLVKLSIVKDSISESEGARTRGKVGERRAFGQYGNVLLSEEELSRLSCGHTEAEVQAAIDFLDKYIERKPDYKSNNYYLEICTWGFAAAREQAARNSKGKKDTVDFGNFDAAEAFRRGLERAQKKYEEEIENEQL